MILFLSLYCLLLIFAGYDDHKKESVTVKPSDHQAQLDAWLVHANAVLSHMWLSYCTEVALFLLTFLIQENRVFQCIRFH